MQGSRVAGFVFKCRDPKKCSWYIVFFALFAKWKHPYLIIVSVHRAGACKPRHCSMKWKKHQTDRKHLFSEPLTKDSFRPERKENRSTIYTKYTS